jgi:phage FluMu protein Com
MAIEFRCTKCNKLLRTADDTSGKHAKCPECGEILLIPSPGTPIPGPMPDSEYGPMPSPAAGPSSGPSPFAGGGGFSPPPGGPTGDSPFAAGAQPQYQPDSGNPYQSPSPFATMPVAPAGAAFELRPTIIDFGDIFSRTWAIFKVQWGMCLAGWIVVYLLNMGVSYALNFGGLALGQFVLRNPDLGMIFSNLGAFAAMFFQCWLFLGQTIYFLKIARGQNPEISDLFSGGPYYLQGLFAIVLWGLACIGGTILLIIPGIIFWYMFSLCYFFVVDRKADAVQSLSLSKQFMTGNRLTAFVIYLVAGIVGGLIVICTCLIGALAVAPFMTLLPAMIYLTATGQPTSDQLRAGWAMRQYGQ